MLSGGLVGKKSKKGKRPEEAKMPEPRVIKPAPAINRKARRKRFFGECPCDSGKAYKNCCFEKDVKKARKASQR